MADGPVRVKLAIVTCVIHTKSNKSDLGMKTKATNWDSKLSEIPGCGMNLIGE